MINGDIRIIRNPSFWVIVFIFLGLTAIYYSYTSVFSFINPRWEWLWNLTIFEFKNNLHGSLFFIVFIYAAIVFWWRGILITWLFSLAVILPRIWYMSFSDKHSLIANILFLLIPLLVVLILNLLKIWRETVNRAAKQREEEHRIYIAEIIKVQEDERKRISREIHDDTTQRLWILANTTQNLITEELSSVFPDTVLKLQKIKDEILQISGDAKRLSLALRPGILDDLGLVPAIRWQVDQLNNVGNIESKILVRGIQQQIGQEASNHVFRIVQEALNNIKRHSGATIVKVILAFNSKSLKITIWDNGRGFTPKDIKIAEANKLGFIGIQERVRLLDGILKIRSRPGKGTNLTIEFNYSDSINDESQRKLQMDNDRLVFSPDKVSGV